MTQFETIIGLEVHVQLDTQAKIFSEAPQPQSSVVNLYIDPVCAGHPGTLPVLNQKAVEHAIRACLATQCRINLKNVFSRKHYFYPDSPKGYQISQFDLPIGEGGFLNIELPIEEPFEKRIGITRIHLEEDAGKSVHAIGYSLINLNRAGVPLIEIVSEPDMRSPLEAGAYLRKLYAIVTTLGICKGNLEEGNFRCDVNVSIRPLGRQELGVRVEIKNINSFRFVEKAIESEVERQKQILLSGGILVQETRLYDSQKNQTLSMRTKEEAQDYRYFPDPDLPPLVLTQDEVAEIQRTLPELPDAKSKRYQESYQLTRYEAGLLTSDAEWSRFFEAVLESAQSPAQEVAKMAANYIIGELAALIKEFGVEFREVVVTPAQLSRLLVLIHEKVISNTAAKQVFRELFEHGGDPDQIIEARGLRQVSDVTKIAPIVEQVVSRHPKQVQEYLEGKEKVLGFLVGQVMKAMGGKANPAMLQPPIIENIKRKDRQDES